MSIIENDQIVNFLLKMKKEEICGKACEIIGSVAADMNIAYYEKIFGELKVSWRTDKVFNARARSNIDISNPPEHEITLFYETVIQIYKDAEKFYEFINGPISKFKFLFKTLGYEDESLKFEFHQKEHFINNFFAAGITYLFGHEMGHLVQEHTHIRNKFGKYSGKDLEIDEGEANHSNLELTDEQSIVWHVTELAADYEAISWCLYEILRHAVDPSIINNPIEKEERGRVFFENTLIFSLAITCVHFRFNGLKVIYAPEYPSGSHPHPILRIEKNVLQVVSGLHFLQKVFDINMSKAEVAKYINKGVQAANLLWISEYIKPSEYKEEYIVGAIINSKVQENI